MAGGIAAVFVVEIAVIALLELRDSDAVAADCLIRLKLVVLVCIVVLVVGVVLICGVTCVVLVGNVLICGGV